MPFDQMVSRFETSMNNWRELLPHDHAEARETIAHDACREPAIH
jgi:hypothetical protein